MYVLNYTNMAYSFHLSSESVAKSDIKSTEKNTNHKENMSFISKDLIAAAGFNVEAPIVEAIIGNLTGALSRKKSETEMIRCKICDCELSSNTALNIHTNGLRHKKRLKALEIIEQLKKENYNGIQFRKDCKNPKNLRCEICSKTVNSAQQLEIHLSGAKHKRKTVKAGTINTLSHSLRKNLELIYKTDNYIGPPTTKKK